MDVDELPAETSITSHINTQIINGNTIRNLLVGFQFQIMLSDLSDVDNCAVHYHQSHHGTPRRHNP